MANNNFVIKFVHSGDIRRVSVTPDLIKFDDVKKQIATLFPSKNLKNFQIAYKDDEEEVCMITNSMELAEAFQVALSDGRKALRLFLTFDESRVKKESVPSSKAFSDRHKKFTKKKVNNTTASKETEATSTPAKVQQTVSKSDVITNGDAVKARIEKRRGKKSSKFFFFFLFFFSLFWSCLLFTIQYIMGGNE